MVEISYRHSFDYEKKNVYGVVVSTFGQGLLPFIIRKRKRKKVKVIRAHFQKTFKSYSVIFSDCFSAVNLPFIYGQLIT